MTDPTEFRDLADLVDATRAGNSPDAKIRALTALINRATDHKNRIRSQELSRYDGAETPGAAYPAGWKPAWCPQDDHDSLMPMLDARESEGGGHD